MVDEVIAIPDAQEAGTQPEALTEQQRHTQAQIDKIMGDPKHPYWDRNHPQYNEAVTAVAALHEARHPEPESEPRSGGVDVTDLRRIVGVEPPLTPHLEAELEWSRGAEADVLDWARRENVPASAMQAGMTWYVDRQLMHGGVDAAAEAELKEAGQRWGFSARQIATLLRWHRAWSGRE